jgi:hypothetical protein
MRYLLHGDTPEVWAYPSLHELINDIESYDVEDGVYRAWDINGRRVDLFVSDPERHLVEARQTEIDEFGQMHATLEAWIRRARSDLGTGSVDDVSSMSTEAMAQEAYHHQQPPPPLLERLPQRLERRLNWLAHNVRTCR